MPGSAKPQLQTDGILPRRSGVVCPATTDCFIRTTQEKFDLVTSDPIDPWVKGCAALNTVE